MIESVSRRAFITSSGSYNVRASEQAKERRHKTLSAVVLFLDDSQHSFQIDVSDLKMLLQKWPDLLLQGKKKCDTAR